MNNNENKIIGYDPKTGNPIYAYNNYNPNNLQTNGLSNFNNNYNGQINQSMDPNIYFNGNALPNNGLHYPNVYLNNNGNNFYNQQYNQKNNFFKSRTVKVGIFFLILFIIIVLSLIAIFNNSGSDYYFPNDSYSNYDNQGSSSKKGKYQTSIVYDHTYESQVINGVSDAKRLIVDDSVSQKKSCPSKIVDIENELINKYNITAVNLCEMDYDYAKELVKVFEHIYSEYPEARKYLTNLSLMNASVKDSGMIACFMPYFPFATANTSSGYPYVLKTQILLNTTYFLNIPNLQISVTDSSNAGHFPPNATPYSPVAHELGHYLSFIALMKHYNVSDIILYDVSNSNKINSLIGSFADGDYSLDMITAAYNRYKNEKGTGLSLDEWRGTISLYALAKDNNGDYIYDETIAEAFHDVYLNGMNAKDASKYIVDELKGRLR